MTVAIALKPILEFSKETQLIPAPSGDVAVLWPPGSDNTVLSINYDDGKGKYETRPLIKDDGTSGIGTNETFKKSGDKLVCYIPEGTFVIPYVEY